MPEYKVSFQQQRKTGTKCIKTIQQIIGILLSPMGIAQERKFKGIVNINITRDIMGKRNIHSLTTGHTMEQALIRVLRTQVNIMESLIKVQ